MTVLNAILFVLALGVCILGAVAAIAKHDSRIHNRPRRRTSEVEASDYNPRRRR